ncbi:MAG: ankyrin repeat domain-containing protein [Gammaproteobacteria bacterium]|nr:ankyrin repeat domain-containing protein [Gammaproteobacteria bacterium]
MLHKHYMIAFMLMMQLLFVPAANSAFYKWVDKNGQVQYTQTPPREDQMHQDSGKKILTGTPAEQKIHRTLIGNWVGDRKNENVYLNFNTDGRFEDRTEENNRFRYNGVGMWGVSGEMIKWEYEQGKGNWSYVKGKTKHFSFIENISESELVLREPDGTVTKLKRITESENGDEDAEGVKIACSKPFDKSATPAQKWKIIIDNSCNDLVSKLLAEGLDPNAAEDGKSILVYAIEKQNRSIINKLIKHGVDVNHKREPDGATPLIVAAQLGDYQSVNSLIIAGARVEDYNQAKCTALIVAAKENNMNIVKKLLSVGANINAVDDKGVDALKHAQERGHRDVVKALQDYKKLTGTK